MNRTLLFFSRGRGHGHAIPDMDIARELLAADPTLEIVFVSYATGARTLAEGGWEVVDLGLPENNPYLSTLLLCSNVIAQTNPLLVIAHEEFAAIPAARIASVPSAFLSAWLPQGPGIATESLAYADAVLILEDPGLFIVPPGLSAEPRFLGPFRRQMRYTAADRACSRHELQLSRDERVVTVIPGGYASEERAPLFDTVADAFARLACPKKKLFWAGGPDASHLAARAGATPDISVVAHRTDIDRLIVASDVIITKGTRGATNDAAALGVPSISLSYGLNPIDDQLVPRVRSNLALNARAVSGPILARYIELVLARSTPPASEASLSFPASTAASVAEAIRQIVHRAETARQLAAVDTELRSA